jgi:hypothetical protein
LVRNSGAANREAFHEQDIDRDRQSGRSRREQIGLARRKHESLRGLRVGLLDNNKPNADKFLQFVGDLLKRRQGDIELVALRK